jgi:predicted metal-binding membrane protein
MVRMQRGRNDTSASLSVRMKLKRKSAMFAASQRTFVGTTVVLFAASTALTITWCNSMSAMPDMPMPGGWSMSMMWMRMPGQTWPGMAMAFLGMWLVMMVAMMLPVLMPMLWRYRRAIAQAGHRHAEALTTLTGAAYFFVWTLFGAIAFVAGAILTSLEMQLPLLARAVPVAISAIVLICGLLQFSAWKAHHLACCRRMPDCCELLHLDRRAAWHHGLRMGLHCVHCCFGLTLLLLVAGVMDLRAMVLVTAAICMERLAPAGLRAARFVGAIVVAAGLFLMGLAVLS